jgi:hypothetical protein
MKRVYRYLIAGVYKRKTGEYRVSHSEMKVGNRRGAAAFRFLLLACLFFLAGMAFQSSRSRVHSVEAASDQVYELMVYHALQGKAPALASVFQGVSELQAKHGMKAVGYWTPKADDPAWQDTFVYLVVHADRESAEKNWQSLHADPAFKPFRAAAAPLIRQKDGDYLVDEVYMSPTAYSASK